MIKNIQFSPFFMLIATAVVFALPLESALADSWWGKGYRSPEWVLSHGGTIIRYEIENISGESDEYKVVMYDEKGKYVEVEYGTKAVFDDAKNGTYTIKADRGVRDSGTYRGGKSFATIKVTAHPGETIKLKFDYKKKKVKMTTDYVKPTPKPTAKPTPKPIAEDLVIIEERPEINEPQQSLEISTPSTFQINKTPVEIYNENFLIETVEEFIHPDAEAATIEEQEIVEPKKSFFSIFTDLYNTIKKY